MKKEEIYQFLDDNKKKFEAMSDDVWGYAETNFKEFKSVEREKFFLESVGFRTKKEADLDTAFSAEYGSGKPVIAILGEYDALDELQQKADVDYQCREEGMTAGHGCGHNLLGTAAVEAAYGIAEYIKQNKISGTVRYYGTPAEEGGAGKVIMAEAGCFDDVDVAISWHPGNGTSVMGGSLACVNGTFVFKGIAAHAAGAPDKGRSALDAAELMNVGTQFLREHVPDDVRIHYSFLDVGGTRPNIVQSSSKLFYVVRSLDLNVVKDVYKRICDIAKGAAKMTGTILEERNVMSSYANVIPNNALIHILENNAEQLYPIPFTEEEKEYAKKFNKAVGGDASKDYDPTYNKEIKAMSGSTDFGDVSWKVPSIGFHGCTFAVDTVAHSWAWTAQGKSDGAHRGMHMAAKLMTGCAIDLFNDEEYIKLAKKEFDLRMNGINYEPIKE